MNATLAAIAYGRSLDMVMNGYFGHFGPNGESVQELLEQSGLLYSAAAEDLAQTAGDAQHSLSVAISALMASPAHRADILNGAFNAVGVGAVTDGDGVTTFTILFIAIPAQ
jgi:uncharacterized protein YkwD